MNEAYTEQLVVTETDDGYHLEGAQLMPRGQAKDLAVVWMHGLTGRFYERHTLAIGRRLAERGYAFITGNNRGHDVGTFITSSKNPAEGFLGGGWWEDIVNSHFDYAAWLGFAAQHGFAQVVLAGHSLGALKAVHYMGTYADERVRALISASGPLRIAQRMRDQTDRIALAQRLVAEGKGAELLAPDATGRVTSAQTFAAWVRFNMDVYGMEREDAPLTRIGCPILFVLGVNEPLIGVEADLRTLQGRAEKAPKTATLYVEGADHTYVGRETVVANGIGDWLDELG